MGVQKELVAVVTFSCDQCGRSYEYSGPSKQSPKRSKRYCCNACRQMAYRERKTEKQSEEQLGIDNAA